MRTNGKSLCEIIAWLIVCILAAVLCSCTIVPGVPPDPKHGAISGGVENDYFIGWVKDSSGKRVGAVMEQGWFTRYQSLSDKYGYSFTPPIGHYNPLGNIVDAEHVALYKDLRDAPLRGVKPAGILQRIGL